MTLERIATKTHPTSVQSTLTSSVRVTSLYSCTYAPLVTNHSTAHGDYHHPSGLLHPPCPLLCVSPSRPRCCTRPAHTPRSGNLGLHAARSFDGPRITHIITEPLISVADSQAVTTHPMLASCIPPPRAAKSDYNARSPPHSELPTIRSRALTACTTTLTEWCDAPRSLCTKQWR